MPGAATIPLPGHIDRVASRGVSHWLAWGRGKQHREGRRTGASHGDAQPAATAWAPTSSVGQAAAPILEAAGDGPPFRQPRERPTHLQTTPARAGRRRLVAPPQGQCCCRATGPCASVASEVDFDCRERWSKADLTRSGQWSSTSDAVRGQTLSEVEVLIAARRPNRGQSRRLAAAGGGRRSARPQPFVSYNARRWGA
jgi:hypothetical protein